MRSSPRSLRCFLPLLAAACLVAATPPLVARSQAPDDPVVVAVGDLACQSLSQGQGEGACRSGDVADLVRALDPDAFLVLGDAQYSNGKLSEYLKVWDVQFGDLLDVTQPSPGNHDYGTPDAAGYFGYFGAAANPPLGYYSFDLGRWHVVSLDSPICGDQGCGPGSPQYQWLAADLAGSRAACTIAFMHELRYDWRPWQKWVDDDDTTPNGGSETDRFIPLWELMVERGVDIVLGGHNHLYQRWLPQDAHGNAVADGVVQFTVGTGGRSLYSFGTGPRPANLVATQNKAFGVLRLVLHRDSYDYAWVGVPGEPAFQDSGTAVPCN